MKGNDSKIPGQHVQISTLPLATELKLPSRGTKFGLVGSLAAGFRGKVPPTAPRMSFALA